MTAFLTAMAAAAAPAIIGGIGKLFQGKEPTQAAQLKDAPVHASSLSDQQQGVMLPNMPPQPAQPKDWTPVGGYSSDPMGEQMWNQAQPEIQQMQELQKQQQMQEQQRQFYLQQQQQMQQVQQMHQQQAQQWQQQQQARQAGWMYH